MHAMPTLHTKTMISDVVVAVLRAAIDGPCVGHRIEFKRTVISFGNIVKRSAAFLLL